MLRAPVFKTLTAMACLVAGVISLPGTVSAQNRDAGLQVRFGSFLQGAIVNGDASVSPLVGTDGPFAYFSKGIGIVSGIEIVNKRGWNYGVEIDAAFMDGKTDKLGQQFGIDYVVTARARVGTHVRPDLLWYASTGPALRGSDLTTSRTSATTTTTETALKFNRTRWGWAIGTGLEWDYGGGILFGEYLYAGFGNVEVVERATPRTFNYDAHTHAFRVGLKFKVGHDHYYHDDVAERIGRRQEPLK
jgi:opacity protein-like surface antigen